MKILIMLLAGIALYYISYGIIRLMEAAKWQYDRRMDCWRGKHLAVPGYADGEWFKSCFWCLKRLDPAAVPEVTRTVDRRSGEVIATFADGNEYLVSKAGCRKL